MSNPKQRKSQALNALPSVDLLLRSIPSEASQAVGSARLATLARAVLDVLRGDLLSRRVNGTSREELLQIAQQRLESECANDLNAGLRRVINATGVVLHTNLGRAPLAERALEAIANQASGYCTLEFDAATGTRGKRGQRAEQLLKQLANAEDALIVNNCAAAALLVLTTLARDGETVVSRGELVEIGGDFRVPDVLANSGTRMVEVGTTNRTKLDDYRRALGPLTRVIMRIHPSNYRIIGFTAAPSLTKLAELAHDAGLVLYEDAGSGVVNDLSSLGLADEPIVRDSIAAGADVVTFSGDKLLGGPQAGLIVGRGEIIDKLRRHSLYRALRADKLSLAALEATLELHVLRGADAEVPALRMLGISRDEIETRARRFLSELGQPSHLHAKLVEGESAVGGGSGPSTHPPTMLIALSHDQLSADQLEARLRQSSPPVIGRIADDLLLLDLRTVGIRDESALLAAVRALI